MDKLIKKITIMLFLFIMPTFLIAQYVPTITEADIENRTITANQIVGVIDGESGVTSTGGSTYNIPIKLPAGVNNMTPELSIAYNSQNSNGLLGLGWNLNGLSCISLTEKDAYHDNVLKPISLNGDKSYLLDGMRLIPEIGSTFSFHKEVDDFSTITSFGMPGNAESFVIYTKDGSKIKYGNSINSVNAVIRTPQNIPYLWRIDKAMDKYGNYIKYNYTYINNESKIDEILYGVNKVKFIYSTRTDKNSSYVSNIPLDNNNGIMNNHSLLTKIEITTDNGAVLVKKYEFIYKFDGLYSCLQEVKEIGSDNSSVINSTLFKYGTPTELSNPSTISTLYTNIESGTLTDFKGVENFSADFNGDGLSDIITFYYDVTDNNGNDDPYSYLAVIKVYRKFKIFLKSSTYPNGFSEAYSYDFPHPVANNLNDRYTYLFKIADFNGDGRADILIDQYIQRISGLTYISHKELKILYNYSTPMSNTIQLNIQIYPNSSVYTTYNYLDNGLNNNDPKVSDNALVTGDFDGDGAIDILHTLKDVNNNKLSLISYPSKNEMYSPLLVAPDQIYPSLPVNNVIITNKIIAVADFDGDKRDEIYTNGRNIFRIDRYQNSALHYLVKISTTINPVFLPLSNDTKDFVGDFNGDGKADVLTFANSTAYVTYSGNGNNYITSGLNFPNGITLNLPYIKPTDPNNYTNVNFRNTVPILADFNGDGKCDILFLKHNQANNTSSLDVCYSIGTSFVRAPTKTLPFIFYQLDLVADFNGDGALDLLRKNAKFSTSTMSFPYEIITLFGQNKEHLLNKISDGFNRVTEFQYKYFSDKSISYQNANNYNFIDVYYDPNGPFGIGLSTDIITGLRIPLILTAYMHTPDGIGNRKYEIYYYNDAYFHRKGKGFMGFNKVYEYESLTEETTEYERQKPTLSNFFTVPIIRRTTFTQTAPNNQQISFKNSKKYNYIDRGNKCFFAHISTDTTINYIEGSTVSTNYTFDQYGNINQTVQNNSNIETTTTTYNNLEEDVHFTVPYLYKDVDVTTTRIGSVPFTQKTHYEYNPYGEVVNAIINNQSTTKPINVSMVYDGYGNTIGNTIIGNTDGGQINISTTTPFTSDGRYLDFMVTPNIENKKIFSNYDTRWGLPTKIQNYNNTQYNEYTYDIFGKVKTITPTASLGYYEDVKYEWASNPTYNSLYKITRSAIGTQIFNPTIKYYDLFNRLVRSETIVNNKTKFVNNFYDNKGNIIRTESNNASGTGTIITNNTYDIYNRLLTSTNSTTGVTVSNSYNVSQGIGITINNTTTSQPNKITKIDPTDKVTQITESADGSSVTNAYFYHSNGNLLNVTQASKQLIICEYDENGNQTKLIDIDAGATEYVYDAFGNITKQTDANGNVFNLKYDTYNRLFNKSIKDINFPSLTNTVGFEYFGMEQQGENKIKKVTYINNIDGTAENIIDEYKYEDPFDRLTKYDRSFEGKTFSTLFEYENHKLKNITYPKVTSTGTALKLTYTTTDNGYITKVNANAGASKDLFTVANVNDYNAFDQITKYKLGRNASNGVISENTVLYNAIGLPERIDAKLPWFFNAMFQVLNMDWDMSSGNLLKRTDACARSNRLSTTETFEYDGFNRLTSTKLSTIPTPFNVEYDKLSGNRGNITKKYDAGTEYLYKSDKIHAVEKIKVGVQYPSPQLDDRTDISIDNQDIRTVTGATSKYNAFNQPALITEGNKELKYIYDYNGQRIKSIYKENGVQINTRYYFGNYEFESNGNAITTDANITRQLHYIHAPNGLASIMVREANTNKYFSVYTDHLGSIVNLIDDNSNLFNAKFYDQCFDAWGRQRNAYDWKTYSFTVPAEWAWLNRGFTGHEMLNKFNLINMNGRLYDPIIGRMLSPDNFIQDPYNTQNYNRYSYVLNNPLKYIDPSGQNYDDLSKGIVSEAGTIVYDNVLLANDDVSSIGAIPSFVSVNPQNSNSKGNFFEGFNEQSLDDLGASFTLYRAMTAPPQGSQSIISPMIGALNYAVAQIEAAQQNRYVDIFNASQGHSNGSGVIMANSINGFYSQSLESYNDFMNNATASNGTTPWQVGWEWLTGNGPRHRDFTNGDYFTKLLQQHSHVQDTRNTIATNIMNDGPLQGNSPYSLGGPSGVIKYLKDYSTLLTLGTTGNLAVTYLGSYDLQWTVLDVNKANNTAKVNFVVTNSSTIQSATHPPLIGYTDWWSNNIGNPLNKVFNTGPLSKTTQTFNWTEIIKW